MLELGAAQQRDLLPAPRDAQAPVAPAQRPRAASARRAAANGARREGEAGVCTSQPRPTRRSSAAKARGAVDLRIVPPVNRQLEVPRTRPTTSSSATARTEAVASRARPAPAGAGGAVTGAGRPRRSVGSRAVRCRRRPPRPEQRPISRSIACSSRTGARGPVAVQDYRVCRRPSDPQPSGPGRGDRHPRSRASRGGCDAGELEYAHRRDR